MDCRTKDGERESSYMFVRPQNYGMENLVLLKLYKYEASSISVIIIHEEERTELNYTLNCSDRAIGK